MIDRRVGSLAFVAVALGLAYVAASFAMRGGSAMYMVMAAPFVVLFFARPQIGILSFTMLYPLMPSSEGISSVEVGSALVLALLVFSWFYDVELRGRVSYSPRRLVPIMALFFAWLCISLFVRLYYGGRGVDWVRDMVPLANLALLLPAKDYFWERDSFRKLLTTTVLVMILVHLRAALQSFGIPFQVPLVMHGTTFHPVVLVLIGLGLLVSSRKVSILGIVSLVVTLVMVIGTTNRTVFLSVILAMGLFFLIRFGKGKSMGVAAFALLAGYFVYLGVMESRPEGMSEKRMRLESLLSTDQDLSFQNRKDEARECWRIFQAYPVAGIGLGYPYHFWRHFIQGLGPGYLDTNYTHSDFMNLLAKTGSIGALLWILLVGTLLVIGLDAIRLARDGDPDRDIAIALTLSIFMSQIVGQSTPVLQSREAMYLFGIVAGLLVALHHRVVTEAKREKENAEEKA